MQLTTKSKYAVRALVYMLQCTKGNPVQIREIAESEKISKQYIEQLFMKLRRSGIIKSLRGPSGGYVFSQKPENISIGDIVRSVEGPISFSLCDSKDKGICARLGICKSYPLWKKINKKVENVLDSINLGEFK